MLFQSIAIIAASAALVSAQGPVYNQTTGQWICPASQPNGDFCAGPSLTTNIIIRCYNGYGGPGNCDDNLSGYPPLGLSYAPCWQTSASSGDAACSKNCVVECASGGCGNGTKTLPDCTPIYSSTTSSPTSSSTTSTTSSPTSSPTTSSNTTTTTNSATTTKSGTTLSTTTISSTGTGSPSGSNNGTATNSTGSASKTPVGPTTSSSAPAGSAGAANAYRPAAAGSLAGLGLAVAFFL